MWQMAAGWMGMLGVSAASTLVSSWLANRSMRDAQRNQEKLFANNAELQKLTSEFEALNKKAVQYLDNAGKHADAAIPPPKLLKNMAGLGAAEVEAKNEQQIQEFLTSVATDAGVSLDDVMADFKAIADGNAIDTDGKTKLRLSADQLNAVSNKLKDKINALPTQDATVISSAIEAAFGKNADLDLSSIQNDLVQAQGARTAVYNFGHHLSKVFEGGALLQEFGAKNEELKQKITATGGTPGSPGSIANTFPAMADAAGALAMGMPAMMMGGMPGGMLPFGGSGFDPAATMLQTAPLMNAQEMAMCAQLPPDQRALFLQQKILARQQQMMMYISNKARMEADTAKSIIQNIR